VTPLQYEEIDGALLVGSARGQQADWVRNIAADPHVEVRVGSQQYDATAEIVTDMQRIVEFLELRLRRHPRMVGAMLRADGLSIPPERAELEAYAARLVMVVIRPDRKAQDARE
jgi:deazaflavin-dependent oxidoreductase (nitroreductase family)